MAAPGAAVEVAGASTSGPKLLRAKLTGPAAPTTVAVTVYAPTVPFAEAVMLTRPAESVVPVAAASTAAAPEPGVVNVTSAPGTGLVWASCTVTIRGCVNAAPIAAV